MWEELRKKVYAVAEEFIQSRIASQGQKEPPRGAILRYEDLYSYTKIYHEEVSSDIKVINSFPAYGGEIVANSMDRSLPRKWTRLFLGWREGSESNLVACFFNVLTSPILAPTVKYWIENPTTVSEVVLTIISSDELSLVADRRYSNMWIFKTFEDARDYVENKEGNLP